MPDLISRHRAVMPSWSPLLYDDPIEIVHGKGRYVTDAEGVEYLDFFGGIVTNMLGYDVAEVRDAVERQLARGVVHTSPLYLIRSQVELAEKIARLSGIPDAKVFFTNSGTEANETALLLATCARGSDQVLAMRGSYHGRSFGTIAATGSHTWKNSSLSPVNVHYLHGTDRELPAFRGMSDAQYIDACAADLEYVLSTAAAPDVACLIAEPIQGVNGFAMPPDGLFGAYKEVLDAHGILFVSDEVQTAWGRTGAGFWGFEAHGIQPDVLTFAKGVANGFALGGVVAPGWLMDTPPATGISTFGGNPVATTAANATLDYVLDHELQANAARIGALVEQRLRALPDELGIVGAVRVRGLMFAIDLVDPATGAPSPRLAAAVLEETRRNRLLVGKGGLRGSSLRMAPPLTLDQVEANTGLDRLVGALHAVAASSSASAAQGPQP